MIQTYQLSVKSCLELKTKGLNKMNSAILTGRITKDLELRQTQGGTAVLNFGLAVDRRFKKDGEQTADFINIVCWGKTAELVAQYMSKGSKIGVIGRIQTGSYEKEGQKVYTTDVIAEQVEFLDSKKKDETEAKVAEIFPGAESNSIPF